LILFLVDLVHVCNFWRVVYPSYAIDLGYQIWDFPWWEDANIKSICLSNLWISTNFFFSKWDQLIDQPLSISTSYLARDPLMDYPLAWQCSSNSMWFFRSLYFTPSQLEVSLCTIPHIVLNNHLFTLVVRSFTPHMYIMHKVTLVCLPLVLWCVVYNFEFFQLSR